MQGYLRAKGYQWQKHPKYKGCDGRENQNQKRAGEMLLLPTFSGAPEIIGFSLNSKHQKRAAEPADNGSGC
jgi:hypothetical protein